MTSVGLTSDYFEFPDTSEETIEKMIRWWLGHEGNEKTKQSIEGNDLLMGWPMAVYFYDEHRNATLIEPGDRLYYRGDGVYELVKV